MSKGRTDMKQSYAGKLADTIMKRYPQADLYPYRSWCYPQGLMLLGMAELWERSGDRKLYNYIMQYVDEHVDAQGNICKFKGNSMDDMMTGAIIVWAYQNTKKERYLRACRQIRNAFDTFPRNSDGGFWHSVELPHEMWVDGVFMGQIFLSKYGAYIEDRTYCFDEAVKQLTSIYYHCHKQNSGLIYHAWSEDKKASWADPVTGVSPEIWSEGLGWYALIMIEVLKVLPKNHTGRKALEQQYLELCSDLKQEQSDNGLWYQVVDKGYLADNWCDTSGSAMFLYSMAAGMEAGILSKDEYNSTVQAAYQGLLSKMVINDEGLVDVYDACDGLCVQNSYDIYVNYTRVVNAKEAVAACLWATVLMEYPQEDSLC